MRVLQSAIQNHPQSYSLLHVQCDFLRSKGKTEWALKLAKQAVNQAEDRMGLRDSMDAAYALHHLAHAHNTLSSDDYLQGQNVKSI